ncbi:MAG TPA: hypothetical protein VFU54_12330 [Actinomycetota bacterium]|nr:hypothetical protein [Actinomycetota bacterium]
MRKRITAVTAAVGLAGLLLLPLLAAPAAAHEDRKVGSYDFVVGFGNEPAYAGVPNSVQLILSSGGKPVTDLKDTLKVAVTTGDAEAREMAMRPNFLVGVYGEPGDYRADFIPTAAGKYTFHFTGTIKGRKIDQSFTSSPTGFDEAQDPAQVQYPVPDPSGTQVAGRLDRETARLNAAVAAERDQARDDAAGARRLATVALVVGALGLLAAVAVGGMALRRRS